VYVEPAALEPAIAFYEAVQGVALDRRFSMPSRGLELATVGGFVLVAGGAEALSRVQHVQATIAVEALEPVIAAMSAAGAAILDGPRDVPTGRNLTARHPDGTVVEYVQPRGDGQPG
jgi:predicted enzyme related to lactoylglutathione lyase